MYETVWSFDTARFTVALELAPEDMPPEDCFDLSEDVEAVHNGDVEWFTARVAVYKDGHEIGTDYLGGCAYRTVEEFYTGHRDKDPMNRNSSIMRAAKGNNCAICHYFPDMIAQAIADARNTLAP